MRKLVVAICLLNVAVPMRDESRKGEGQQERKTVVKNSSGVLIKFYRGQKGYLLKDHGLA